MIGPPGCLALFAFVGLAVLLPLFLADAFLAALGKLGLSPQASLFVGLGIFFGGLINLPVKRLHYDETVEVVPLRLFGLGRLFARPVRRRRYTLIAVNVGGCLVPLAVALYQLVRLANEADTLLVAAGVAIVINVLVSYRVSRPVPRLGIAMPPLIPAVLAAACGLILAREHAAPIAFAAGVLGPLLGADLLHLRDLQKLNTGVASLGGAGTFDGIVISGLLATLLA